ncbi:acyl-CoA carboxylase subunit epsilon [Rhodococcus sp. NPDC058521]|uniref:acyl-CoA carboxylase subunit epsilon n=1 Tax=Rhodococcus sp. NPDC058521 TaxID=3346536 RepID=UPI00364D5F99
MTSIAEEVVRTETSADESASATSTVNGSQVDGAVDAGLAELSDAENASSTAAGEPFVKVVKGSPTDEELAALVTVLAAAANSGAAVPGSTLPAETWGDPVQSHRVAAPFSPYSFVNLGSHRR